MELAAIGPPERAYLMGQLLEALLHLFPTRGSLERFLFHEFGWRLQEIAGADGGLEDTAFDVVRHADSRGTLDPLVKSVTLRNPDNVWMREFMQSLPTNWSFDRQSGRIDVRHLPDGYVLIGAVHWRICGVIGRGGRSTVYRAERFADSKRPGALKVLHQSGREGMQELQRELDAMAELGNDARQHLAEVFDKGWDPALESPWFAMELLDGANLRDHVQERGRLPPSEVVSLVHHLATVLEEAHARDVIHCDLKPENVFFARSQGAQVLVKLLDFGTARVGVAHPSSGMGTAAYAAPEQWEHAALTPRTDVWAVGLVAYFALTGHDYWRSIHAAQAELLHEITHDLGTASARADGHGLRLVRSFDRWFSRCVRVEAEARFDSVRGAAQALAQEVAAWALAGEAIPAFTSEPPPAPPPGRAFGVAPPTVVFGRRLDEVIAAQSPMDPHWVVSVLEQVAAQLLYARSDPTQHAPLDPTYISVDEDDAVHLMTLRGALVADPYHGYALTSRRLDSSVMRYVSPRVLRQQGSAEPDDVWSIAMIAFEMLTGRAFLEGVRTRDVYAFAESPPAASERAEDFRRAASLPGRFDAWFSRCVQITSARYTNASAAVGALSALLPPRDRPSRPGRTRSHGVPMPFGMREGAGGGHFLWPDPTGAEIRMLLVPPGSFRRGSDEADEWPSYWCRLTRGVFVSQYPMTVGEYERFVRRTEYRTEAELSGAAHTWRAPGFTQSASDPVVCVTWNDAREFCRWAGLRLLTETEWEYAARGNADHRLYPWGDAPPDDLHLHWSGAIRRDGSSPVGRYPLGASPFDLLDMTGNVACWTEDAYARYPRSNAPVADPRSDVGSHRVVRGVGWREHRRFCARCSARRMLASDDHDNDLGFRCAIAAP